MKKYLLMSLVILAMAGTTGCTDTKSKENSQPATLTEDSSVQQSSTIVESEVSAEVEDSKPNLFERAEQSLEPVTSDNVIADTSPVEEPDIVVVSEVDESTDDIEVTEVSDDTEISQGVAETSDMSDTVESTNTDNTIKDIGGLV